MVAGKGNKLKYNILDYTILTYLCINYSNYRNVGKFNEEVKRLIMEPNYQIQFLQHSRRFDNKAMFDCKFGLRFPGLHLNSAGLELLTQEVAQAFEADSMDKILQF